MNQLTHEGRPVAVVSYFDFIERSVDIRFTFLCSHADCHRQLPFLNDIELVTLLTLLDDHIASSEAARLENVYNLH